MQILRTCLLFGLVIFVNLSIAEASNFQLFNPFNLFQQASQSVRRVTQLFKSDKSGEPSDDYVQDEDYVDVDMADRVASLVSNGIGNRVQFKNNQQQKSQKQEQPQSSGPGLFGGFMRLLGLDSTRLGAIAVNAFIYVSEMIAATLTKRTPMNRSGTWSGFSKDTKDDEEPEGTPFSWLLSNASPKVTEALKLALNPELPEILITLLKGRSKRSLDALSTDGPTHCLQRLMCQISPVMHGMQQAVSKAIDENKTPNHAASKEDSKLSVLWRHMPTREALVKQGDLCEAEFPDCHLYDY